MKYKFIALFVALTLVFAGLMQDVSASAAGSETISFPVEYRQKDARKMFDMLNEYRAQNGANELSQKALVYDYNLERVAMQRAAEIAVRFNTETDEHYRPDGQYYKQTLADFGFDISPRGILYGENILFGTQDSMELEDAFDMLCGDDGNRKQMLGYYSMVGIGHIKIEEKTDFWVQVFANSGTPGNYTDPVDAVMVVSVKVDPAIVSNVSVDFSSGNNTVAVGSTVEVPKYIPKISVIGSEMDGPLTLAPLSFNSNDGFVSANGSTMTGLQEGSGNISASLLGNTYSYTVTVTAGNGAIINNTPSPTQTVTPEPTAVLTQQPTVVLTAPPTTQPTVVLTAPPTSTPEPTVVLTVPPISTPEPTVVLTPIPTSSVQPTAVLTPEPTANPSNEEGAKTGDGNKNSDTTATKLKKGDTFSEGGLNYKVTASGKVAVTGLSLNKATSVTIPATVKYSGISYKVTSIASSAFSKKTKLKSVEIGKNVSTIGSKAFFGCKNLKTVNILGSSVKKIGKKAFTKINKKATISVASASYKSYKKLLDKSGISCTVKKV